MISCTQYSAHEVGFNKWCYWIFSVHALVTNVTRS